VHLSNEIQKRLDRLNSSVQLATTIDGMLPGKYSFYDKPGKSFRTEFAMTKQVFQSFYMKEPTNKIMKIVLQEGYSPTLTA